MLGDRYFRKESLKKCSVFIKKENDALKGKMKTLELEKIFELKQIKIEMNKLSKKAKRLEKVEEVLMTKKETRERRLALLNEMTAHLHKEPTFLEQKSAEIERKLRVSIKKMLNEAQEKDCAVKIDYEKSYNEEEAIYDWNQLTFDKAEIEKILKKLHNHSPYVKVFCDVAIKAFEKNEKRKKRSKKKIFESTEEVASSLTDFKRKDEQKKDNMDEKVAILTQTSSKEGPEKYENEKEKRSAEFGSGLLSLLNDSRDEESTPSDMDLKVKVNQCIHNLKFLPKSCQVLFKVHQVVVTSLPGVQANVDLREFIIYLFFCNFHIKIIF